MGTLDTILGLPSNDDHNGTPTMATPTLVQQQGSALQPSVQATVQTPASPGANGATEATGNDGSAGNNGGGGEPARHLSYVEMMQQMSPYKPPTDEELAKERRKQKREQVFAAIGDGLNAFHQAYANARGVKPMTQAVSLTGKLRERYEKLEKERNANGAQYLNAYMRAMQADDEGARDARNWRRTLERDAAADRRDQRDYENKVQQQQQQQQNWQQSFDRQGEQWNKQFEEGKRQFNVSSSQAQQRINLDRDNRSVSFALGAGRGTINVPTSALNASNVSFVFSKLPESVRATVQGEPIYEGQGRRRTIVGYKPISTDAMLIAIGQNIENSPDAQDALRTIAGQQVSQSNTPPSRRGAGDGNTPPSRR